MVTKRDSQGVRCIKTNNFQSDLQHLLKHFPNLFLACIPISCYRLFNFSRCIFGNRNTRLHGRCDGYTLCSSEFKHALYILTIKRRLNSKIIRFILFYKFLYGEINKFQPLISIHAYGNMQHIHFKEFSSGSFNTYQAPSHHQGTGINAKDYFGVLLQRERYF